jgi:diguanylate cyclase (GGDEF)-like protein
MEQSKIFKQATSQILNELMKSQELVADTVIDKDSGFAHAFSQLHNYESVVQKNSLALKKGLEKAHQAIVSQDLNLLDEVKHEVVKLRAELNTVKKELYSDELTKVYNRRWLFEHYTVNSEFLGRGILIFFDLNQFKLINDKYGHLIGDRVLKLFAEQLKELKPGLPMRYAGDEFILICEESDLNSCEQLIDQLKINMKKLVLSTQRGERFKVGFSSGMVSFRAGDEVQKILELADAKMYQDKAEQK